MENLNSVMAENSVQNVNVKRFMADSAQTNWNAVRTIYGDGNPSLSMVVRERTCLFHWFANLNKVTQNILNRLCNFNTHKYARITKTQKQ